MSTEKNVMSSKLSGNIIGYIENLKKTYLYKITINTYGQFTGYWFNIKKNSKY